MAMYLKGKLIDENWIIGDAAALPNNTTGYISATAVDLGMVSNTPSATYPSAAGANGNLMITVVAHVALTLASTRTLTIVPHYGTTTSPTTPTGVKFSVVEGTDTKTSWAAGEIICQFIVPTDILAAGSRYLKLEATTTADQRATTVDAFVSILA